MFPPEQQQQFFIQLSFCYLQPLLVDPVPVLNFENLPGNLICLPLLKQIHNTIT